MRTTKIRHQLLSWTLAVSLLLPAAAMAQDDTEFQEDDDIGAPATTEEPVAPTAEPMVEDRVERPFNLGIDAGVIVPFGDYSDVVNLGIGALVRGEFGLVPNLRLTGRVGYLHHLQDAGSSAMIPILVGVRYVLPVGLPLFVAAETGGNILTNGETNFRIPLNIGVGYELHPFQVGLNFFMPNFLLRETGEPNLTGLLVTVGYTIF